jgi:hypothetical protein
MSLTTTSYPQAAPVALGKEKLERNFERMKASQRFRYNDWWDRHDDLEHPDRSYQMPRIREIYSRALVTEEQRAALHATRRVVEALVKKTFMGSEGEVGEWVQVLAAGNINPLVEHRSYEPKSIEEASLKECLRIMRENSYDISEGVRFIRTPLALPVLERKYYVTDLLQY